MAYYYVRDDGGSNIGTATGDGGRYASVQTGSWFASTSAYYASIGGVLGATTPPTGGDTILFANDHSETYSLPGNTYLGDVSGATLTNKMMYISVDTTDMEAYLPGASIAHDSSLYYWRPTGITVLAGIDWSATNAGHVFGDANEAVVLFYDATLRMNHTNTSKQVFQGWGGATFMCHAKLYNCIVQGGTLGQEFFGVSYAGKIDMYGGSLVYDGGTGDGNPFVFGASGARLNFYGTDCTDMLLVGGAQTTDDECHVRFVNCALNGSLAFQTLGNNLQTIELYNSDSSTAYHRFRYQTGTGTALNNDSTYVTNTEAWFGGSTKSSIEVTTTAECDVAQPFEFELIGEVIDLSDTASDVLSIELVTDNITLTDRDIKAYLMYPDGTTKQANFVSSGLTATGSFAPDVWSAGSTLPTGALGAADWTGEPATPNFYKLVLDTSGDPGSLALCKINIQVTKPSIPLGDLFIHPIIQVS